MSKNALMALLVLILMLGSQLVLGQVVNLTGEASSVKVSGTSTLHDWEMSLTTFKASAHLDKKDDGTYFLSKAEFTAKGADLKGDKSMMNNKAHEALKVDDFPEISFYQKEAFEIKEGEDEYSILGELSFAGKRKSVTIPLKISLTAQNELSISGETSLKMTDFDMEPPSVMFGTINTDDLVKVSFNLTLK
ncbi:YceI family protein [Thermophagus sp. OGC60D27]|uniref:YceI family protein n=1 Tax=Thermophagus sp. OGC60D27 TaxID=3458415 RepID=UPI004037D056